MILPGMRVLCSHLGIGGQGHHWGVLPVLQNLFGCLLGLSSCRAPRVGGTGSEQWLPQCVSRPCVDRQLPELYYIRNLPSGLQQCLLWFTCWYVGLVLAPLVLAGHGPNSSRVSVPHVSVSLNQWTSRAMFFLLWCRCTREHAPPHKHTSASACVTSLISHNANQLHGQAQSPGIGRLLPI